MYIQLKYHDLRFCRCLNVIVSIFTITRKSISFKLNESMNYDTLSEHNSDDFWSLLLHTGYLTVDFEKTDENELTKDSSSDKNIFARIPNLEIRECFTNNIKERFSSEFVKLNLPNKLVGALSAGNTQELTDILFDMLQKYVSVRDTATKAPLENYYHGFLNGLFSNCSKGFFSEYHSNCESGDGYADIVFKSKRGDKVVIIEIKSCKGTDSKKAKAREALAQIEEKNYAQPYLENEDVSLVYAYGISFIRKDCEVLGRKIK